MSQQQAKSGAAPASVVAATPPAVAPESETVSLHAPAQIEAVDQARAAALPHLPEVFAEIWKDGMKIGSIYTDGHADLSTLDASVAASLRGTPHPYLQAQEISRMVGGEIRFVDLQALQVAQRRSQLRAAYGA